MNKKKILLLAIVVMFLWGSLYPFVKLGFKAYNIKTTGDILFFAGIRFAICGAIICIFSLIRDKKQFIAVKSSVFSVITAGLFAIVLHYSLTYLGLSNTQSSKTAIIKQIGILFYIFFAGLFFKDEKLTIKKVIGVFLGFLGVVVINFDGKSITFEMGDLLIVGASFCTVFSNVVSKKLFQKVDPITATGCFQLFGGVCLLIIGTMMGGKMQVVLKWSMLIMVYICLASIVSYCIWYLIIKENNLSNLFIIKFAEPLFSCIIGAIILNEKVFKLQYLLAFALIVLGIVLANLKGKTKNKKRPL